jgi:hypothetical protein
MGGLSIVRGADKMPCGLDFIRDTSEINFCRSKDILTEISGCGYAVNE